MKANTKIKTQNINQENLDLFNNLASLQNIKKNVSNHKKPKTFFDFCAGIGSAHLAFKRLGLACAGYSEIDAKAEKLYKSEKYTEAYPLFEELANKGVIKAQYRLGWFYDLDNNVNHWKCPFNFRNQPMQKVAADILGLEYKETRPLIKLSPDIEKENLITIALHGTAQSKYWNNKTGWQDIVDFVKSKGYRVMLISKESDGYMGNSHPIGIEKLESGPMLLRHYRNQNYS